jgi:uncharacterized protein (DUF342 family)
VASGNLPALTYNARQYRVRLELTRAMAMTSLVPPIDLIQRAKLKLESIKKEGKILFYELYEEKLLNLWKGLRAADGLDSNHPISITIGAGAPQLNAFHVVSSGPTKPGVLVSTTAPIDLKLIPREWVRMTILKMAKEHGINDGLFMPQLQSAIMRLSFGEKLDRFHIGARSSVPAVPLEGKVYTIMANKTRGEVIIFIGDIAGLQSDVALEGICGVIVQTMKKMMEAGLPPLKFLKSEMISCIKSANSGAERVGVERPFAVLAVIPSDPIGFKNPVSVKAAPSGSDDVPDGVKKYLNFKISDDKMLATIDHFDMRLYSDPAFIFTKEFLSEQLSLSQIEFGLTDEIYDDLESAFKKRLSLDLKVAAAGKPAIIGADPYLHLVYKDAPKEEVPDAVINIRDAQQRSIVKKGQFVAEVRFRVAPMAGHNVLGQGLNSTSSATLAVTIGEGIQAREAGKFYATADGLPRFEEGTLTINKIFVHEGDVNLKSGNIYFDGPVEITGSIEKGSLVRVRGPLKVHGSIIGAIVISKEPIEVLQSINTGETGKVICATKISADFIENSRIECDGSITAKRSIISSEILSGQFVHVTSPDGFIGGGSIVCRGTVFGANIGFTKGARTKFLVGIDHRIVRRIAIREKRLAAVTKAQERYKHEFRDLAQKKDNQLTLKHKQQKESLKEKMTNVRPLLEKLTQQLEYAKASKTYSPEAMIAASNVFAANCQIEISGHNVIMEVDTIAAAVCAKERRNSHICTFDEIKGDLEKKVAAPAAAAAPAPAAGKKAG